MKYIVINRKFVQAPYKRHSELAAYIDQVCAARSDLG